MKKIGFTIGKFAPLHKGHQYLIEKALSQMDEFYIVIYSTDVINIPIDVRANWIKKLYPTIKILYAPNPPKQYGLDEKSVQIQMEYLRKIIADNPFTHFYSSEEYGKYIAKNLNIEEVIIDKQRIQNPISGTEIRNNPEQQGIFLDKIVYEDMKKYK